MYIIYYIYIYIIIRALARAPQHKEKNSEGIALGPKGREQLNKPAVSARLVNKPVKQA